MKTLFGRSIVAFALLLAAVLQAGCGAPPQQNAAAPGADSQALDVSTTGGISTDPGTDSPRAPVTGGFTAGTTQPRGNDGLGLTSPDATDNTGTPDRTASAATPSSLLEMPLLNQNTAGGSYPAAYCGPTTVRMVLGLYGMQPSADEVALTDFGSGPMYRKGAGSTHEGMATALRNYGLNAELSYGKNLASVRAAVERGHAVIVNLRGNYGPFYTKGHITVIVGFTENGDPIINDSAGGVRRTIPARTFLNTWQGLQIETWK